MLKIFVAAMLLATALPVAASAEGVGFGVTIGDHDHGDRYRRDRGYHERRHEPVVIAPDIDRRDQDHDHDRDRYRDRDHDRAPR